MAKLYFRYGAMNSGKSTALMQVAHNYEEQGMKVLILKPQVDTKGGGELVSRLGKAVSRFITTDTNGYKLIAAFDVAENEVGKEISGIRIRHIDELEAFCEENKPKVAVLCVPRDGAQQVSGRLVDLGIEGFWNFSHYDLSVSYPNVVVENVHLGDSLMSLGYRLRNQE